MSSLSFLRTREDLTQRLAQLRAIPGILPGGQERLELHSPLFPVPIPRGAITELCGADGCGKTELAIRLIAAHPRLRAAWAEESFTVYPRALIQMGVTLDRVLFVEPGDELLWAAHQLLRSQLFGIVVLSKRESWGSVALRRLQLLAEKSQAALLLLNKRPTITGAWPIHLQFEVRKPRPGRGTPQACAYGASK